MTGTTFNLRDLKELTTAADHLNHLLQHDRRGRGVRVRFEGATGAGLAGAALEGRVVGVATLFEARAFLVTFVFERPEGILTVGGAGARLEAVAAERLVLL